MKTKQEYMIEMVAGFLAKPGVQRGLSMTPQAPKMAAEEIVWMIEQAGVLYEAVYQHEMSLANVDETARVV